MEYIDKEYLANIYLEKITKLANEAFIEHKDYFDLYYFMTKDTKASYIGTVNFTPRELTQITPFIWRNIIASEATFMALRQLNRSELGFRCEFMEDNILRFFLPKQEHRNMFKKYI